MLIGIHYYEVRYFACLAMYRRFSQRLVLLCCCSARAIENQCYVIAAAQYGQHNEKRTSYGHSLVVDGWGNVIVDAGGMDSAIKPTSTQPTITTCEIDLSTIDAIRENMPIQQHRANVHVHSKGKL